MIYIKNTPVTKNQRGATLIIALVMLVMLTLFAISAISLSNTNLKVVGNMQARMEAQAAGKQAIEQVISSAANLITPLAQTIPVDINNDGTMDYTAIVTKPSCYSTKPLTNAELIPASGPIPAKDLVCISSSADPGTGVFIANAPSAQSWCYDQKWRVSSTVTDSRTDARVVQHQGVSLRVPIGTGCPAT